MNRRVLASLFLLAVCVAIPSTRATAAPVSCVTGSLTSYLGSGGGCSIGSAVFSDFGLVAPLPAGATPISTDAVTVVPFSTTSSVGLTFQLDLDAQSSEFLDILFGYNVAGSFATAALGLTGASASGDGVVTAVKDVCVGGSFTSGTLDGCANDQPLIALKSELDDILTASTSFAPATLLGIVDDIGLDGGSVGAAALAGSVTNEFSTQASAVPEPGTALLLAAGLAGLLRGRIRR